mgnify:CR=1 FL=1
MITPQDKELLENKGISEEQIAEQLACFEKGFPYLKLSAAASVEKGILAPDTDEQKKYLDAWEAYTQTDKVVVKFVPASGAASRMFKNLFEFLGADYDTPQTNFEKTFFEKIEKFAFYDDLNTACQRTAGKDIPTLVAAGNYKAVVAALLEGAGLNYGALPKGLLKFHKYEDGSRTPLEEHLVEGALYAANKNGKVNVHFTVSPEHRALFKALVDEKAAAYAKKYGVDYNISFSEQKPSTDTIAADMENKPFRDNGKLLFRPGGHGALIENLNDLDADIIFIKNIDNVVPDKLKGDTVLYKKLIAGVLVVAAVEFFDQKLKIDDPVGAISVHGICGAFGTIATGLFALDGGLFYGGGTDFLVKQIIGVVTVAIYVAVTMTIIFKILDKFFGLRVKESEEIKGLDMEEHGLLSSYADFMQTSLEAQTSVTTTYVTPVKETAAKPAGAVKMSKVVIITSQNRFEALKSALDKLGITGMTVTKVLGYGIQKGSTEMYRGAEVAAHLLPKVKVEMIVSAIPVAAVVNVAKQVLYTGKYGDGKIFIYDVEDVVKIRTGETGYDALQDYPIEEK